ncbi:SRPBCC family protein [Fodinibacter luteus]|uniref:SRPBCC family protein n=1 Tax=Fodinibacter luteus TaxID=552064 RepID=A0ABP8KBH3_9MICO
MPTDTATSTVVVDAPLDEVLATIRAIEALPQWVSDIKEAEVLTADADGMPLTARFAAATAVGTDRYTLAYEHADDGMSWHLVEGRLQTGQDATYTLRPVDDDHTEVTFTLTISHNLPLPGFIRNRTIKGLVTNNTGGLRKHLAH